MINDAYHDHIQSFCICILDEIKGRSCDDWESNFALGFWHIRRKHRKVYIHHSNNLAASMSPSLTSNGHYEAHFVGQIGYTLRNILTKEDKSRIYSRAAAYCIQFLSNHDSELSPEAQGFIQIRSINKRIRQHRPWHWHRTFRHRLHTDQLLYINDRTRYPFLNFQQMLDMDEENKESEIRPYSIFSINWSYKDNIAYPGLPYRYMSYLEYLVEILPQAEPYIPLINMCRTKTFSRMSIAFPALSRRARRMMAEYLERAESTIGTGDP